MLWIPRVPLDEVQTKGFSLGESRDALQDVALLSLRSALRAYLSTYSVLRNSLQVLDPKSSERREEVVRRHGLDYAEACFATVVHFQHFAEMVCKRVLYQTHPLLAVSKLDKKHELIFKLLKGEPISDEEAEKLQWSEFSESLDRATAFVKSGRLDPGTFGFILAADQALSVLNSLRNRLLHRGRFFVFCDALDELVAGIYCHSLSRLWPFRAIWDRSIFGCTGR